MKWTTKQPKVAGYYWMDNPNFVEKYVVEIKVRYPNSEEPEKFLVFAGESILHRLGDICLKGCKIKWAGPIQPPK